MSEATNEPLPVAVIGCGRMGRLHARVYSEMSRVKLVGVYDSNPDVAGPTAEAFNTKPFNTPEDVARAGVKAVTVAVPTTRHLEVARPLLEAGVACLIEKPLAGDVATAREIAAVAEASGAVVQVGHIERFNPAVRSLSRLGVQPRYIEVVRISPFPFRSIDVGVVLDVMIHDIDIVLSLANSKVVEVQAQGVSVVGGGIERAAEDVCNARLTFENGCVASLTASRLALKTERRLRVFSPEAYVSLDYQKKSGMLVRRTGNLDLLRDTIGKIRGGEITDMASLDYKSLLSSEELVIDDVEPLRAQLEAFCEAAEGKCPPAVSAAAGVEAVEVAERVVAAIPEQSVL